MKKRNFWLILCAVWLVAVTVLFCFKVHGIAYLVSDWKQICHVVFLTAIPAVLFGIGSFLCSKKSAVLKRLFKALYIVLTASVALTCFALLVIVGVYSSTDSADNYLIPDRDIQLEQTVLDTFPQDLQNVQSCRYRYVRGKNLVFWDGNGWRIALSASYDSDRYASEVDRLRNMGLCAMESPYENMDAYWVTKPGEDGVSVKVLFSEQTRTILYYAYYLDLDNNETGILSEVTAVQS